MPFNVDTFREACGTAINFGRHRGKTIARIGSNDEGLSYLVWLKADKEKGRDDGPIYQALSAYLSHPDIAARASRLNVPDGEV